MRNRAKRYISILVVMLLAIGCIAPAGSFAATAAVKEYSDVKGTVYESAVKALTTEGIITGYDDGTFQPDGNITRAEVSKIFGITVYDNYEGSEKTLVSESDMKKYASDSFADLAGYNWASQFIGICAKLGIVEGYGNSTFKPGNNITYNELTAMVVRAANYDMSKIEGTWPENYISAGEKMKLYDGIKEFKPYEDGGDTATRGNTAIIVNNALKTIKEACKAGYAAGNKVTESKNTLRISLDDALKRMKGSGMLAQLASANYDNDRAIAQGYGESIASLNSSIATLNEYYELVGKQQANIITEAELAKLNKISMEAQGILMQGMSTSSMEASKGIVQFQRTFINDNIDANYQADMNSIEATTYQLYYGIIQAEDNVASSKAALKVQEQKTANTKRKFDVGMASQIEVQQAEMALLNAQSTLIQAENALESAQLNFKMLLNVDYRTNLVLTTPIKKTKNEVPTQANAISSMLSKNMTLKYYDYLYDLTGKTAAMYPAGADKNKALAAQSQTLVASNQTYNSLRANMISAYSELPLLEKNIESMESTVALAEKGYEIATIQFSKGMITQADLDNAELSLMQANLGLTNAIATYNLAIYDINYNAGVGTSRVTFS